MLTKTDIFNIAQDYCHMNDYKNKPIKNIIKEIKKMYPEIKGYENQLITEIAWLKK